MLNYCIKYNRDKNLNKNVPKLMDKTTKGRGHANQYDMLVSICVCFDMWSTTKTTTYPKIPKFVEFDSASKT